jgi:hypothetical protein
MRPTLGMITISLRRLLVSACLVLLCGSALRAQQVRETAAIDSETVQLLMKRIDKLEARVKELEVGNQQAQSSLASNPENKKVTPSPPATATAATAPEPESTLGEDLTTAQAATASSSPLEQTQQENATIERTDLSKTLLRIRGFGDVSLHGDTMKGDTTSFSLGQLDLFITSDMSEKFKFLADILFEGGPDNVNSASVGPPNTLNVDVERYLLQYSPNDFLNISAGKGHTAIGYYSTAYQHSTWLQTAVGRPFLYEFEDHGGILPIHMVGVSASGIVPAGNLGLHYVAEVGDGRSARTTLDTESSVGSLDDENRIAYNLGLFARPENLPGFQIGLSAYRDVLTPPQAAKIGETIIAGHAILIQPKFEWLNEAVLVRQTLAGTRTTFNTPGYYSQIAKQFGSYRPYFRYQFINVSSRNPVFSDVGLRYGPSAGIRYDANESVALKFQYDYTYLRKEPGVHGLTMQVGFTF